MVNKPIEHCPYCGAEVRVIDWPQVNYCESCEDYVFHNAVSGSSIVVIDGDSALLIDYVGREEGQWRIPGGIHEIPEHPRETAARELEEETGLAVDSTDLRFLFDTVSEPVEEKYMVGNTYTVARSETSGTVRAGDDAQQARFWTVEEFADADRVLDEHHRRLYSADLGWLIRQAREVLESPRVGADSFDQHLREHLTDPETYEPEK